MKRHIEHFRGNEEFVRRAYDLIDQMERHQRVIITPFFSPDQIEIVKSLCGKQIQFCMDGGYAQAERCRIAFLPEGYSEDDVVFPIASLKATCSQQFASLSHRDVLGAFMNMGIERDKVGDFIVKDSEVIIIIDRDIENYIVCNLTKIKRSSVHFKPYQEVIEHRATIRYEQRIVSSLRLDTLVASLCHLARGKAQALIVGGCVKVNHVVLEQTSFLCNNNSAISIRGYGRFVFVEVKKSTKKQHFVIEVGMYE